MAPYPGFQPAHPGGQHGQWARRMDQARPVPWSASRAAMGKTENLPNGAAMAGAGPPAPDHDRQQFASDPGQYPEQPRPVPPGGQDQRPHLPGFILGGGPGGSPLFQAHRFRLWKGFSGGGIGGLGDRRGGGVFFGEQRPGPGDPERPQGLDQPSHRLPLGRGDGGTVPALDSRAPGPRAGHGLPGRLCGGDHLAGHRRLAPSARLAEGKKG